MNCLDKKLVIEFLQQRMDSLQDRINRDYGSGLTDDLGKYNEAKMLKEKILRGELDIKIWE